MKELYRVKGFNEYRTDILNTLKDEGIEPQVFLDHDERIPQNFKTRFRMEFDSEAFRQPVKLLQLGYTATLIQVVAGVAEHKRVECLDLARELWKQLRKKGIVK